MIYIQKNEEPKWLYLYKKNNPTATYDTESFNSLKNEYDSEKFISPLNPKCEDIFTYYPDGIVEGDQYTIDLLNLNAYELREARKAVYKTIMNLDIETIELIYSKNNEQLPPYYNVIKWFIKVRRGKLSD
ncbi:MAG: hypothetical protein SOV90_10065 [Lachnospiraceae bacterium]|nr:Smr/MutS family endonuclease [Clostridiales bacterium]MDD6293906.1 hypothetical protein [Eubacteriales bacterium]MDY2608249.1 hypothetical protein [Lachnospiraceae bacterium]